MDSAFAPDLHFAVVERIDLSPVLASLPPGPGPAAAAAAALALRAQVAGGCRKAGSCVSIRLAPACMILS